MCIEHCATTKLSFILSVHIQHTITNFVTATKKINFQFIKWNTVCTVQCTGFKCSKKITNATAIGENLN